MSKCLVSMKEILYGTNDKEPHTETVAQLAQELYNSGLLITLVENLQVIDFEVSIGADAPVASELNMFEPCLRGFPGEEGRVSDL